MRRADDEHQFRLHHQRSVPSADPATASPSSSSLRFHSAERRAHTIEVSYRAGRDAEGRLTLLFDWLTKRDNPSSSPPPSFRVLPELLSRPPALHQRGGVLCVKFASWPPPICYVCDRWHFSTISSRRASLHLRWSAQVMG